MDYSDQLALMTMVIGARAESYSIKRSAAINELLWSGAHYRAPALVRFKVVESLLGGGIKTK